MLIIDGHNVMGRMPENGGQPKYWTNFVRQVEEYARRTSDKIILALDLVPGSDAQSDVINIQCRQPADPLIMELLEQYKGGSNTLVSSDRELVGRARRCGFRTMPAHQFKEAMQLVLDTEAEDGLAKPQPTELTAEQTSEWLQFFGADEEQEPPGMLSDVKPLKRK